MASCNDSGIALDDRSMNFESSACNRCDEFEQFLICLNELGGHPTTTVQDIVTAMKQKGMSTTNIQYFLKGNFITIIIF
jgi:hypothetical protein